MNRQTRTLLVLLVALLAAGVAAYGVYAALSRIPVREVEVSSRQVVVAAKAMPVGTLLTPETLKVVAWPESAPLQGGFDTVEAAAGRGLVSAVVENEPIVESKVASREAGAGLPPSIPPGMRAMSVRVNEVIGVAGFVVPGTRVDVMVVLRQRDDGLARVVVSNVQVLAAGTKIEQETRESKPIQSTVVTLLVSPEDAEKIALAQSDGQLMLSLRNPLDVAPTQSTGVRTATLFGAPPKPASDPAPPRIRRPTPIVAVPVVQPPPPPSIYTVEAIRGAKRTEEPVR